MANVLEEWLALYSACQWLMADLVAYKLAQAWRAEGRLCGGKKKYIKKNISHWWKPSETCHFSHSLSQPWDTLQTHLRVVHAIYQEDKETLQKKKRNRKNIRKKLLKLFSFLYYYFIKEVQNASSRHVQILHWVDFRYQFLRFSRFFLSFQSFVHTKPDQKSQPKDFSGIVFSLGAQILARQVPYWTVHSTRDTQEAQTRQKNAC